jgi:3-oxoacyl-[acyl-carrier-protein] synthase II
MGDRTNRRVAITGLGAVSSLGVGAHELAAAVHAGEVGTSPITGFDATGFPIAMAGEVHDFVPDKLLERLEVRHWGRSSLFAAGAARLAFEDSRLDLEVVQAGMAGSVMGTTSGESAVVDQLAAQWVSGGLQGLAPELVGQLPASQIAAAVNAELGLTGEAVTVPTACSASNYALGYSYDLVRSGEAEFMIAGGADSVNRWTHAGFYQLGAMADDRCRPFDADRSGILTAEGGVALLLEPLGHARARGGHVYAEVLGYAMNCDAKHMVRPDPASIAECIRSAQRNAGIEAADVDYICAHGTGTPTNDTTEVCAIRQVFGDEPPPTSSIKSMIGHTMGAASGFGALMCCMALDEGIVPPTANVRRVDPAFGPGFDCVPDVGRRASLQVVENHGFAFGGNNAIVILGKAS